MGFDIFNSFPEEFLKQIFSKSDAYLCISEVDGEAILVKEAAALNTPVITTQMLGDGLNNSVEMIETPVHNRNYI